MPSTIELVKTELKGDEVDRPAGSFMARIAGFFFAARIAVVLFSVRVLGTEPSTGAELSLGLNLLLLLAVCFHSLGSAKRTFGSMMRLSSVRWVAAFLLFSGCSLAWSVTVSPPTSVAYWCGMAADVAIVILLLRDGSVAGRVNSLMKGYVSGACCLAVVAWLMPVQADLRLGDEDFLNTNQIGNLCAFAVFLAQYLMRSKAGKWGPAAVFLTITLIRSLSKTTIVAFLISECLLLIQDRTMTRKSKIVLASVAVVGILAFWGLFEAYYDIYTTAGNQAETFTGRTAIWAYSLDAAIERPWIGHGFDSMWKVAPPFGSDRFEARHAENEVLQQFYAYGVAGIAILVLLYGSLYRKIRKLSRGPLRVIFLSLMLFIVVRGLAEAEPFDLLLPLWSIVSIAMLVNGANVAERTLPARAA